MSAHDALLARLWPRGETLTGPQAYTLVDGAQDPQLARMIRQGRLEWTCLFGDRLAPALQATAPYLVHLSPDSSFTHTLLDGALHRHWGFVMTAPASVSTTQLRRHFKRFLRVQDEAGKALMFRFYDPRVLRLYFPSCTASERARFLGPVEVLYLADGAGRAWHALTVGQAALPQVEPEDEAPPPAAPPSLRALHATLAAAHWSADVLAPILPLLRAGLPSASYPVQRDWAAALRRVVEAAGHAVPGVDVAFDCGTLAMAMDRPLLAAHYFRMSLALRGPHPATHFNLGLQLRLAGHYEAAIRNVELALAAPGHARFAAQLASARVQHQRCLDHMGVPLRTLDEPDQVLGITLLERHHAPVWQRRLDAVTARAAGLPSGLGLEATRRWIREQATNPTLDTLAVLHDEYGLVGGCGYQWRHNAAVCWYWIAPAFRGRGFGTVALRLLAAHALHKLVLRLYVPVGPDDAGAQRALGRAGYAPVPGTDYWILNLDPEETDVGPDCYPDELALLLRDRST